MTHITSRSSIAGHPQIAWKGRCADATVEDSTLLFLEAITMEEDIERCPRPIASCTPGGVCGQELSGPKFGETPVFEWHQIIGVSWNSAKLVARER